MSLPTTDRITLKIKVYLYDDYDDDRCCYSKEDIEFSRFLAVEGLAGKTGHDIIQGYIIEHNAYCLKDLDCFDVEFDVNYRQFPKHVKDWFFYNPFDAYTVEFGEANLPESFFTLHEFPEGDDLTVFDAIEVFEVETYMVPNEVHDKFLENPKVTVVNVPTFVSQPMSSLTEKEVRENRKKVIYAAVECDKTIETLSRVLVECGKFKVFNEREKCFIIMINVIDNFRFDWKPGTPHMEMLAADIKDLSKAKLVLTYPYETDSKGCKAELALAEIYDIPVVVVDKNDFNSVIDSKEVREIIANSMLILDTK